jgi:hypothetical protein
MSSQPTIELQRNEYRYGLRDVIILIREIGDILDEYKTDGYEKMTQGIAKILSSDMFYRKSAMLINKFIVEAMNIQEEMKTQLTSSLRQQYQNSDDEKELNDLFDQWLEEHETEERELNYLDTKYYLITLKYEDEMYHDTKDECKLLRIFSFILESVRYEYSDENKFNYKSLIHMLNTTYNLNKYDIYLLVRKLQHKIWKFKQKRRSEYKYIDDEFIRMNRYGYRIGYITDHIGNYLHYLRD